MVRWWRAGRAGGPVRGRTAAGPGAGDSKGGEGRRETGRALGGGARVLPQPEDPRLAVAHEPEALARGRSPEDPRDAPAAAGRNAAPTGPREGQGRLEGRPRRLHPGAVRVPQRGGQRRPRYP